MVLERLWSKWTSPTTRYTQGQIENSAQFEASRKVQSVNSEIQQVADAFLAQKESDKDSVYGSVRLPNGYGGFYTREGFCKFDDQGQVTKMNIDDGQLTLEKRGDHKEICSKSSLHGSGRGGSDTEITEQWITVDGSAVKYQTFSYWLGY